MSLPCLGQRLQSSAGHRDRQHPANHRDKRSERDNGPKGSSSHRQRQLAVDRLPLDRLTASAQSRILSITRSPTFYRRLPAQAIDCDRDMFMFLARKPEVMVGMWELMGITHVQIKRTGVYQLQASDGLGTTCEIDLIYGDPHMHIYLARGSYDGKFATKPIHGSGIFIVNSSYAAAADGRTTVTGTIDCFLQLDSFGADLIARTLSGFIGRSADSNFVETARFVTQVSQASARNPDAMTEIAGRLPQVDLQTQREFANVIERVFRRSEQRLARSAHRLQ